MCIYSRDQRLFGIGLCIVFVQGVVWIKAWWKPCRVSGWESGFFNGWWKPCRVSGRATGLVQCLVETLPCFWFDRWFDSNMVETPDIKWIQIKGPGRWLWWLCLAASSHRQRQQPPHWQQQWQRQQPSNLLTGKLRNNTHQTRNEPAAPSVTGERLRSI